jgi:hypothetical protein
MKRKVQETILGVAFKLTNSKEKDKILQDPFPTSHLLFLNKLCKEKRTSLQAIDGFYSNLREFLTREEAHEVATQSKQLIHPEHSQSRLYSKNLIDSH